jgi:hypothetical protein
LFAAIGENEPFRVANWHNHHFRQAKEMRFVAQQKNWGEASISKHQAPETFKLQ